MLRSDPRTRSDPRVVFMGVSVASPTAALARTQLGTTTSLISTGWVDEVSVVRAVGASRTFAATAGRRLTAGPIRPPSLLSNRTFVFGAPGCP